MTISLPPSTPDNCAATADYLDAYLDGELPPAERERVHEHLATCPSCRAQARAIAQIKALVKRSCRERAPVALGVRIQQQVTVWSQQVTRG